MTEALLYERLPFLQSLREARRQQILDYFKTAPDSLADCFTTELMPANTIFIREDSPAKYVYLIADGVVKATDYRVLGIEFDFILFDKVYALGGMEVLMDMPNYRTTLTSSTECIMIRMPRRNYESWLLGDLAALKHESHLACEYLLEQARLSRAYLFLEGADRLAMLLVCKYEKYAKDGYYESRGKRQNLANEVGMSMKSITRALKRLTDEGLVTPHKYSLSVNQEQYLQLKARIDKIFDSNNPL